MSAMKRPLFLLAGLAFAALPARADMPAADPLFAAQLSDLADKPATLAAYKGKPLIVNFWARWCVPCRKEIPELNRARAQHRKAGAEVIGLALEDQPDAVKEFAKAYDIEYPVLLAKDNGIPLMQSLDNPKAGLPFTLALDRRGKVVYKKLGGMSGAEVDAAFAAALGH